MCRIILNYWVLGMIAHKTNIRIFCSKLIENDLPFYLRKCYKILFELFLRHTIT